MPTVSSRELNRDVSAAKRAAEKEPVFVTDRGVPKHVLMSFSYYKKLTGSRKSIVDMLAMEEDIDFEIPKAELGLKVPSL